MAKCNLGAVDSVASADKSTIATGTDASTEVVQYYIPQGKIFEGLCPMCGIMKNSLPQTGNFRTITIASRLDPDIVPIFEAAGVCTVNDTFRVCTRCDAVTKSAINIVCATNGAFKEIFGGIVRNKTARTQAKVLKIAFVSQGRPLLELFRSLAKCARTITCDALPKTEAPIPSVGKFSIGGTVCVHRRNAANELVEGITRRNAAKIF